MLTDLTIRQLQHYGGPDAGAVEIARLGYLQWLGGLQPLQRAGKGHQRAEDEEEGVHPQRQHHRRQQRIGRLQPQ
uniref:hypothetical protein n=1 Tax=Roseicyclus amphidinii TaxID=3034232 RepID=UPI0024E178B3